MANREQRGVVVPLDDGSLALEGLYVAGAPGNDGGAVIAAPHPQYGGSMDSPVVNELAWACRERGLASLCFNWRGVGASAGAPSGEVADANADYRAALEHLTSELTGSLCACGYSWGAATTVRAGLSHPRVERAILVAPPPVMLDAAALTAFDGPVLVIVGDNDSFAPVAELTAIVKRLTDSDLVVVPEADHFFGKGLSTISREALAFLERTR